LDNCTVGRENINWDASGADISFLPIMKTDITIKSADIVTIMDTKYYRNSLARNMETEKFHSNNLYQIFSYLKNAEAKGEIYTNSRGILLYPEVDKVLDESYEIQGHVIKVCTLNLNDDWDCIYNRLLEVYSSNYM
ncbi:MAG: 5-methylcytosine restriction system specificity protein McrC, partial [Paraclostridium sp.]